MKKVICLLLCVLLGSLANAQRMLPLGAGGSFTAGAPATYTGPGDIATYSVWWGLTAYSTATRGTKAVNVCNVADVACGDLSTDATTGLLTITTIGGSSCAIVTCTCKTIYDKVGTNDITQPAEGTRPVFNPTGGPNNNAACVFSPGRVSFMTASISSLSQPWSLNCVVNRTGSTTSFNAVVTDHSTAFGLFFNNAVNQANLYGGSSFNATANDNAWHSIGGMVNNGTNAASLVPDGSSTLGTTGTGTMGTVVDMGSQLGGANFFDGRISECGLLSGDQSSLFASISTNRHSVLGF